MKEEQLDEMAYAFGKKRNMLMHNSLEPFESVHVVAYSLARVFIYINSILFDFKIFATFTGLSRADVNNIF